MFFLSPSYISKKIAQRLSKRYRRGLLGNIMIPLTNESLHHSLSTPIGSVNS